jgi:transposase
LAEWQRQYDAWKQDNNLPKPSQAALRRQLNAIKRQQFPWMLEVTKNATQMAIMQFGDAFKNFFAGRAKYPKFRKKGVHDRFTLTNDQFRVEVIASASLIWAGCECGSRCALPEKFCRPPSPVWLTAGLAALPWIPKIHPNAKPKTKAR